MPGPLWTPSPDRVARANLTRFGQGRPYAEIYDWSVAKPLEFWDAMWEFGGVIGTKGERVAVDMDRMPGAQFFPDGRSVKKYRDLWTEKKPQNSPFIPSVTCPFEIGRKPDLP